MKFIHLLKYRTACSLFLFVCLLSVQLLAQVEAGELLRTAEYLSANGLHQQAIIEYHRTLFFSNDSNVTFSAYYRLGCEYREMNEWVKAEQAFENAELYTESDSMHMETQLALATIYLSSERPALAKIALLPFIQDTIITQRVYQALILFLIADIQLNNWNSARNVAERLQPAMKDSNLVQLLHSLNAAEEKESVDPETAKWLSTFLPGSGQLYAGDIQNGVHAFALNSFNGWIIVNNIVRADYLGALLYTVFVAERYYEGNRVRAEQIAIQKNGEAKTQTTQSLLRMVVHFINIDQHPNK